MAPKDFQLHVMDSSTVTGIFLTGFNVTLSTPCNGFALKLAEEVFSGEQGLSTPCNGFIRNGARCGARGSIRAFNSM